MFDLLKGLKYDIPDRKVDARLRLLGDVLKTSYNEDKYVILLWKNRYGTTESSSKIAYEDNPIGTDTTRSMHASPASSFSNDRTSIEDFEILKPISRGAIGRVLLATKRAMGDLFASKYRMEPSKADTTPALLQRVHDESANQKVVKSD